MNKTITIHLQGTPFTLEEEAYNILKKYLDDITQHFASSPDQTDIIADIERSMAEKWSEKSNQAAMVVTIQDVQAMIDILGQVHEFDSTIEPSTQAEPTDNKLPKRLYRNPDDAIIAGVASGIAAYFKIDPVFVRVAFVVLTLLSGAGILLYIVMWLIMPVAKTSFQKAEMTGETITLADIYQRGKKQVGQARQVSQPLLTALAHILRRVGVVVIRVIGILAIIAAGLGIMFVMFVGINALINHRLWDVYPLLQFIGAPMQLGILCISTMVLILIPLCLILLFGIRLMRRRAIFTAPILIVSALVWGVAMITTGTLVTPAIPRIEAYHEAKYPIVTKNDYAFSNFDAITVANNYDISVVQGDEYSVVVTGTEADIAQLAVSQDNDALDIRQIYFTGEPHSLCFWCDSYGIEIVVTAPNINEIVLHDSASVTIDQFTAQTLGLSVFDDSFIDIEQLAADKLTIELSDIAQAYLVGAVDQVEITSHDISHFSGEQLQINTAYITADDNSSMSIDVRKNLSGSVRDTAAVSYTGNPIVNITQQDDMSYVEKVDAPSAQ